ncbi:MAG: NADH-quinone oxidoreductase subunit H, partial [Solirubrobacteraceae bacterium]
MSAAVAGAVQLGGVALAPLLPGVIQHLKGRLQGRPGPSPLEPYRELRRLWGKSAVTVEGTTAVYRAAPVVAASALLVAVLLVPVSARPPDWGIGHDALALAGLLALARFALAAASWDVANGF